MNRLPTVDDISKKQAFIRMASGTKSWQFRLGHRKRWSVMLMSLIAAMLTLEATTRIFRPDESDRFQFDKEVGYLLRPDLEQSYTNHESNETYVLTTNNLGFRGPHWTVPKPDGVKRIAVIGNSFVEAMSFPEPRTFCGKLQTLLNQREKSTETRWEVMNFGIGGNNTPGELAVYRKYVRSLDPDIVILCASVANDIPGNRSASGGIWRTVHIRSIDGDHVELTQPKIDVSKELRNKSKIYVWQKKKIQQLIDAFRSFGKDFEESRRATQYLDFKLISAELITRQPPAPAVQKSWEEYEMLLKHFQDEVVRDGANFIVVHLPDAWQIHEELYDALRESVGDPNSLDLREPERRFQKISRKLALDWFDMTPHFQKASKSLDSEELFLHGVGHFSERGHELVARQIFEYLQRSSSGGVTRPVDLVLDPDKTMETR